MEFIKNISKWGNSAGILLPKDWIGKEVKVILIDRTLQIKKEALDILDNYLADIMGIYLVGSYSRNEQQKNSDIDIIAVSDKIKTEIISGKYHISVIPLSIIKKALKTNPILILPRLYEAKAILNNSLLEEIKSIKIEKKLFNNFIIETKRIIKINEKMLELDKTKEYAEPSILYSLILRLRGIFIIENILNHEKYSNTLFLQWLEGKLEENTEDIYKVYRAVRDNKKTEIKIKIQTARKLLELLRNKIRKF